MMKAGQLFSGSRTLYPLAGQDVTYGNLVRPPCPFDKVILGYRYPFFARLLASRLLIDRLLIEKRIVFGHAVTTALSG